MAGKKRPDPLGRGAAGDGGSGPRDSSVRDSKVTGRTDVPSLGRSDVPSKMSVRIRAADFACIGLSLEGWVGGDGVGVSANMLGVPNRDSRRCGGAESARCCSKTWRTIQILLAE